MATLTTLQKVKTAIRVTGNAFDDEITSLINACILDLSIAGIENDDLVAETTDDLILQAYISFVKWRFGQPTNAVELQKVYELQKAQLQISSAYTNYGGTNGQSDSV